MCDRFLSRPPSPRLRRITLRSAFSAKQGGGARRSRTDDILLAKQALYQLSYGPVLRNGFKPRRAVGDLSVKPARAGRHGQTRTADLTLIRRTL